MSAAGTASPPRRKTAQCIRSALDSDHFAHDEGLGDPFSRFRKDPSKGLAGHLHAGGGGFLVEPFKIT